MFRDSIFGGQVRHRVPTTPGHAQRDGDESICCGSCRYLTALHRCAVRHSTQLLSRPETTRGCRW